jgi:hypothetical protein
MDSSPTKKQHSSLVDMFGITLLTLLCHFDSFTLSYPPSGEKLETENVKITAALHYYDMRFWFLCTCLFGLVVSCLCVNCWLYNIFVFEENVNGAITRANDGKHCFEIEDSWKFALAYTYPVGNFSCKDLRNKMWNSNGFEIFFCSSFTLSLSWFYRFNAHFCLQVSIWFSRSA